MNIKKLSISSGLLYLSLVLIGPVTIMIIPEMFTNADNILAFTTSNRWLLNTWLLADLTIIVIEVFLTSFLYLILKKINQTSSFIMFVSRFLMIIVMIVKLFMIIMMRAEAQSAELLNTYLYAHSIGTYIWQIFFFIHVIYLGFITLEIKSVKKWIAVSLIIGSFGYLFESLLKLAEIDNAILSAIAMTPLLFVVVGEIAFGILLLRNKVITT